MFSHNIAEVADFGAGFVAPADRLARATFQLVAGLGPTREQKLWQAGITDWALAGQIPAGLLPDPLRDKLLAAADEAEAAFADRDLPRVAALFPTRELWRLFPAFADRAVYLDIETDREEGVTAIGILDGDGPRIRLAGRDLDRFPGDVPPDALLVTFNGAAFDVPVLTRAFPAWKPPVAHIDLRPVWTRLGQWGGLKSIEDKLGLGRPDHLRGVNGGHAAWMWRHAQHGDQRALRLFAEYNLYDTINLRALLVLAHDRLRERLLAETGLDLPAAPPFARGDVLYDVSKILLAL
jgi:uncharacterized protein